MSEWNGTLANSALVVWDMQYGIAGKAFNLESMVAKITSMRGLMHSYGKPVIYTQTTGLPYEYQSKYSMYRLRRRGVDPRTTQHMIEVTGDWQIMKELVPDKNDLVLKKYTPSLFVGTTAEQILKNRGIDSLILTGVSTEMGIETTARHAACLGFIPIVVEDAVGGGDQQAHNSALDVMRKIFEVKTTESVIQMLRKSV
ncbi:MAG: cysteine hydrolase family protein [Rhabdochlamydiaceae bacterium]